MNDTAPAAAPIRKKVHDKVRNKVRIECDGALELDNFRGLDNLSDKDLYSPNLFQQSIYDIVVVNVPMALAYRMKLPGYPGASVDLRDSPIAKYIPRKSNDGHTDFLLRDEPTCVGFLVNGMSGSISHAREFFIDLDGDRLQAAGVDLQGARVLLLRRSNVDWSRAKEEYLPERIHLRDAFGATDEPLRYVHPNFRVKGFTPGKLFVEDRGVQSSYAGTSVHHEEGAEPWSTLSDVMARLEDIKSEAKPLDPWKTTHCEPQYGPKESHREDHEHAMFFDREDGAYYA